MIEIIFTMAYSAKFADVWWQINRLGGQAHHGNIAEATVRHSTRPTIEELLLTR
jgi:hypothetical protein